MQNPGGKGSLSLVLQENPEAWGQPGGERFWAGAQSTQHSVDPEESCAVSLLLLPGLRLPRGPGNSLSCLTFVCWDQHPSRRLRGPGSYGKMIHPASPSLSASRAPRSLSSYNAELNVGKREAWLS